VWQSITQLYWPAEESRRVEATVSRAAAAGPVAHIAMEFPSSGPGAEAELTVTLSSSAPEIVARVGDHGIPVTVGNA
jgi:hypothetical protein